MALYPQLHVCYLAGQIFRLGVRMWGPQSWSAAPSLCSEEKGREGARLRSWCPVRKPEDSNTPHLLAFWVFYLYPCMSVTP